VELATTVVAILLPFLKRGAEEFATAVGKAAAEKVQGIFTRVRRWFADDEQATSSLEALEGERADLYVPVVEGILAEKLKDDEAMREQLQRLVDELGPTLSIVQEMEEAKRVIGLRAGTLSSGSVEVTQKIGTAEDVTGAHIDKIG
jgi:hypothetical protein